MAILNYKLENCLISGVAQRNHLRDISSITAGQLQALTFQNECLSLHPDLCRKCMPFTPTCVRLSLNRDRFNAITAVYSLFHVPSNDHPDLLGRIYRWLGPEGKALLTYAMKEYTGSDEFDGHKEFMANTCITATKAPTSCMQIWKNRIRDRVHGLPESWKRNISMGYSGQTRLAAIPSRIGGLNPIVTWPDRTKPASGVGYNDIRPHAPNPRSDQGANNIC